MAAPGPTLRREKCPPGAKDVFHCLVPGCGWTRDCLVQSAYEHVYTKHPGIRATLKAAPSSDDEQDPVKRTKKRKAEWSKNRKVRRL